MKSFKVGNFPYPIVIQVEGHKFLAMLEVFNMLNDVVVQIEGVNIGERRKVTDVGKSTVMKFKSIVELRSLVSARVLNADRYVFVGHVGVTILILVESLFLHLNIYLCII